MPFIPQLDAAASRQNARKVLNQYRRLARIAGRPLGSVRSPVIDGMPRTPRTRNLVDIAMTEGLSRRVSAERQLKRIDDALLLIPGNMSALLRCLYCTKEFYTREQVAVRLGIGSERNVSALKPNALLQFSEAYGVYVIAEVKKD